MARVLVNNEATSVENGLKTLGELLDWADRSSAGRGQLVTAVRLDGVDEPSFRDEILAGTPLDAVATVEFDAVEPAALVAESVAEAREGLAGLRPTRSWSLAGSAAPGSPTPTRVWRNSRRAWARWSPSSTRLGGALGISLEKLQANDRPVVALIDDLAQPLVAIGQAQAQEDWVTVADILEFDLEPALAGCEPLFDALSTLTRPAQSTH